ncbi:uncharacterized protein [Chironomus tepperi]|uniref:uncharacterized protein n=1 Tax=Chironomus tepperi TaxID=113505 RepID=UPI00391F9D59
MDSVNASHKVSCWKNMDEFLEVRKLIFGDKSTLKDKSKALSILKAWKIRRGQETPLGILCTLILVDVEVKDTPEKGFDSATLGLLYGSAITKFTNYATSFKLGKSTMYASANQLGIDSFIIDLRHNFAHGRQSFNLDVQRYSHKICMKWIKEFYWDTEIDKFQDVDIRDIRYNASLAEELDDMFTFYDLLAEAMLSNIRTFDELKDLSDVSKERWPFVIEYMKEKKLKNFRQAFKYFTKALGEIIASKQMRLNPMTFFHVMLTNCDFFMKASELSKHLVIEEVMSEDEEVEITPMKRPKKSRTHSIVNQFQTLIWHIVKNDYLKLLLDMLFQIYLNQAESKVRRKSAHFWIEIILKSYEYYQKYCEFSKTDIMEHKKISPEIKNVYSYQLGADLKNVIIFVGTQMLPTSLKYSNENVLHLLNTLNENDDDIKICLSLMPHIYPPLTVEQIETMKHLVDIKLNSSRKYIKTSASKDRIYSVEDLRDNGTKNDSSDTDIIWKSTCTDISWSSLPLAFEFKV